MPGSAGLVSHWRLVSTCWHPLRGPLWQRHGGPKRHELMGPEMSPPAVINPPARSDEWLNKHRVRRHFTRRAPGTHGRAQTMAPPTQQDEDQEGGGRGKSK